MSIASLLPDARRAESSARPKCSAPHWRSILSGSSPREVLVRLMSGDPLELRSRIARVVAERCQLFDSDRAFLCVTARIARFSVRYRGQPEIDAWLTSQIEETFAEMVLEDADATSAALAEAGHGFDELAQPLGLRGSDAHAACTTFNRLPFEARAVFQALVIEGRTLDELAAARQASATELARTARRVLEALLATLEPKQQERR